ncbi:MAG: biotin--[acetyl-CoA-carboxylase] ligase [Rubrivivax sp.]|nr:biotin--[acetyl-CoA-carboxylase] ligase [Rubrivivax sp.]
MPTGSSTQLRWEAEALWQQLVPLLPHVSVEVVARCESTNSTLIERARHAGGDPDAPVTLPGELGPPEVAGARSGARAGARLGQDFTPHGRRGGDADPCLLVAEQQTRGRGRLGRSWLAAPGTSLTFSLAVPLAPRDWSGLSLAIGLAVADALDPPEGRIEGAPPRIALKWPNDLWLVPATGGGERASAAGAGAESVGGAKLGGILVETVSVGRRRLCVVGIGLNVEPLPPSLADGLAAGHACLRSLDPLATAPAVLARVAPPLVRALLAFERDGFAPLLARYAARDLLRGREVTTTLAHAAAGVAEGVDGQGALVLRVGGERQRIVSGEVSVRHARAAEDATESAAEDAATMASAAKSPQDGSRNA